MIIIHLQHPEQHEFAFTRLSERTASAAWKRGNWGEVSRLARSEGVVLLIPTRDVLLLQTTLVTTSQRQLKQALPYALEESLVDDPAEQHFVWQAQADDPTVFDVAVIKRETLKTWMEVLRKHKLRARTILPDVFALPFSGESNVPTIMQHDGQALIRTGAYSGFSSASAAVPLLIDSLFDEEESEAGEDKQEQQKPSAWLYTDQQEDWHESLNVLRELQPETLLQESIQQGAALNLLNGYQDASMSGFNRNWKRWRVAAVFGLITLGVLAGIQVVETARLKERLLVEEQENLKLFKQAFPNIKNVDVRSLRSRVQSELRLLGVEAGQTDGGRPSPLPYMATVSKTFQAEKQLSITEIRSRRGNLVVRFNSPNVELVDKLGKNLGKNLGFEPRIKSTQNDKGVQAELTLEATS